MSITIENEKQNRMSFVDVQILCDDKIFTNSVHNKPTFSDVYTNFDSFLPSTYKFSTVFTLTYRCFRMRSSWTKLHTELLSLEHIFFKNGYPENFINVSKDLWIAYT